MTYNPYLPLNEYIPDGEPHVFGDRVYIYGSHDRADGKAYCEDNYTVWSAPITDLSTWTNDGTAYYRSQDPSNSDDEMQLWAPDVTRGPDGRYYLFYCFSFYPEIGVAVSENPAGPFRYHGHVHYPSHINDGKELREYMPFDPAVFTDDDGRVYLYYGFCPAEEKEMSMPTPEDVNIVQGMSPELKERLNGLPFMQFGENSMVAELESDMLTLKEEPRVLIPGGHHAKGTGFEGHAFFEASSIRKFGDTYYFVYSSHKSHELCYATSDRPDSGFKYGGIIVSNGDVGLDGRTDPVYPIGNNHGGIEKIGDDYYVFYHRQTNGTEFSRQGCAEKIDIQADGSISQVEITSCGLNGGALPASGSYPASICCHLTDPSTPSEIDYANPVMKSQAHVAQEGYGQLIVNICDGAKIGYKYFSFDADTDYELLLEVRGDFKGELVVSHEEDLGNEIGRTELFVASKEWNMLRVNIKPNDGDNALYIGLQGSGKFDLKRIGFSRSEE